MHTYVLYMKKKYLKYKDLLLKLVCFQTITQTQHSITYLSPLITDHFRRIKYENSEQGKSVDFIKRGGGGKIVLEENRGCILKTQNALAMTS